MRSYAELHVHIEGALEAETTIALAKKNNIDVPFTDVEQLRAAYRYESVADFLTLYRVASSVLRTADDFTELTNTYLAAARASGVTRAEISCDVASHVARGVPAEAVLTGLAAALSASEKDYGISTGLILGFEEGLPEDAVEQAYAAAIASDAELLGVGVCLGQAEASTHPFAPLFGRARADGLHTVAHVGADAGSPVVWDCLHDLKVGRIGACAIDDRDLMYYLADYSIPLTVCPLANRALRRVDQVQHPLPQLLDEGVVATINSGAPAFFGGYLDANIAAVTADNELTDDQLDVLARNSFTGAFLAESRKAALAGLVPA